MPAVAFITNPEADGLLREATFYKQTGDLHTAIACLQRAYAAIQKGETSYPVETFLRLPAYLQQAGRPRDAWQEYRDLLVRGYPRQYGEPKFAAMDHSAIYDKMRLFLQRTGLPVAAVAYGVLAHCSWAIGLHRQSRASELQTHISRPLIESVASRLLKKAGRSDAQQALCRLIADRTRDIFSLQLQRLFTDINALLCVQPHEYA